MSLGNPALLLSIGTKKNVLENNWKDKVILLYLDLKILNKRGLKKDKSLYDIVC